ncbi:MAG: glycosyltransferase family 1 protein [Acidobacteria bacterium]|nr:glycosyltransferase family 1 protein [Acidobacteriota bacterium]
MRILFDYRPALRARTGVGEWIHELVCALLRLKAGGEALASHIEVTLLTASLKDRPEPAALAEVAGATLVHRRLPVRPLTWAWNRLNWPPVELVTGARFDVVHATSPLLLPRRAGLGVCTIYDLDFLEHPERAWGEMKRDFPALVHRHATLADIVVTISEHSSRRIQSLLGVPASRIAVCRPGTPAWARSPVQAAVPAAEPYLLFVGTIEPRKNIGGLLQAYARLCRDVPGTPRLVLAGGLMPAAQPWIDMARSEPLRGRVEFRGYVSDRERPALYAGASALVLPSFEEGFGLPALEAMALGIPVVVSNRGALPEVVGSAGLLVEPDDPASLAAALRRVLEEPGLAARLREEGQVRARMFDWDASGRHLLECFGAALDRARGGARP